MKKMRPRGVRNNNPGNIRNSERNEWMGEVSSHLKSDQSFEEFETMGHGIRAMMKLLLNYQKTLGLRTTRELVSRWAPHSENDTASYVRSVCKEIQIPSDYPIDLTDKGSLCALVNAMCFVECGERLRQSDLDAGWELLHRK